MSPADIPAPIDATDPAQPAATLPAPPTRSQGYALERAIRTAAEHQRPVADIVCTGDRRLLPALMARGWVDERGYLTDAGYNAAGVAAPGQPWGGWTVAYRTRTGKNWATTARRVRNWAGTWQLTLLDSMRIFHFSNGKKRQRDLALNVKQALNLEAQQKQIYSRR